MISITIGKEIKVNKKDIDFISRSDQSFAVVRALFPAEFRVNAKDFRYELQLACIRLSTDRTLGDYGVVVLQTATQGGLLLPDAPEGEIRCRVRVRYKQKEQWATVRPLGEDAAEIFFDEPQRAITSGQAAVLYDEDVVLGGGTLV